MIYYILIQDKVSDGMSDELKPKRKRWSKQDEWDKANIASLGCKVRKEEADIFKEYAVRQGKTVNTLLKEYVLDCINDYYKK